MSYEEKRTWVYLLSSTAAYAVYLAVVWGRALHSPVAHVSYVPALLWTTLASTVASTAGTTLVETARHSDSRQRDVRDREIARFGEHTTRWFAYLGAMAAMFMAMARWDYFWIANAIYLGFVLWAISAAVVKLVAYRRGL